MAQEEGHRTSLTSTASKTDRIAANMRLDAGCLQ